MFYVIKWKLAGGSRKTKIITIQKNENKKKITKNWVKQMPNKNVNQRIVCGLAKILCIQRTIIMMMALRQ